MVLNSMFLARFMRQWSSMRLGNWLIEVVPARVYKGLCKRGSPVSKTIGERHDNQKRDN